MNSEERTALRQLLALRVDPESFEETFGAEDVRIEVSSLTYLLKEVEEACAVMQRNRPSLPYRAIEKGAALLMFGLWRREGGADATAPALAAANVVLAVIENMFVDPAYVSLIRRQVPDFDPIEEVSWAKKGVKHNRLELCFTRAVTMITHELADRFASGRANASASAMPPDDIVDWGTALLMGTAYSK